MQYTISTYLVLSQAVYRCFTFTASDTVYLTITSLSSVCNRELQTDGKDSLRKTTTIKPNTGHKVNVWLKCATIAKEYVS